MLREFHYHWRWELASPPEALWPLVSDTSRFDRATGLPKVTVLAAPELPAGQQRGSFRIFGVPVEWDEEPFEWVAPRSFATRRRYRRGPTAEMELRVELEPSGSGTLLKYDVRAVPANALGQLAIPLQIGLISAKHFGRVFKEYDSVAAASLPPPSGRAGSALGSSPSRRLEAAATGLNEQRLTQLTAQLKSEVPAAHADLLAELIARGDDVTLSRVRPYTLARQWGIARADALALFLRATRAGLLDLQWDLLCPRCRGAKDSRPALAELRSGVHCDACRINFDLELEGQVELTFRVSPAVRSSDGAVYCIGGPGHSRHVALQQQLAAGESRTADLTLAPGNHQLRTFATASAGGTDDAMHIEVRAVANAQAEVVLDEDAWSPATLELAPTARLTLRNASSRPQLVLLERTAWRDDALTVAELGASQEFRDLFSRELLRPGESISVGTLTVAFTDLKGSTAMYRSIGDAPAFARVLDHFAVIRDAVAAEDGAVVKTMGDAVLAVFHTPAQALRAMAAAQQALAHPPDGATAPLALKVGLHSGHCIAVTLSERLDYFGTTMNLGARLTELSSGHDIVLTDAVRADGEVRRLLAKCDCEGFSMSLRGLEGQHQLWRVEGLPTPSGTSPSSR